MVLHFFPKKLPESTDFLAVNRERLLMACTLVETVRLEELERARNAVDAYPLKNKQGRVLSARAFQDDLIHFHLGPEDQKVLGVTTAEVSQGQLSVLANPVSPVTLFGKFKRLSEQLLGHNAQRLARHILASETNCDRSEYERIIDLYPSALRSQNALDEEEALEWEGRSELQQLRRLRQNLRRHRIKDIVMHAMDYRCLAETVGSRLKGVRIDCSYAFRCVANVADYEVQIRLQHAHKNPLFDHDERQFFSDPASVYDRISTISRIQSKGDREGLQRRELSLLRNSFFAFGPSFPKKRLDELLRSAGLKNVL